MSDPSESSASKEPAEYRPRPLMGVTFWAMIALMLLCVLAGIAIAILGPRWLAPRPAQNIPSPRVPAEPPAASTPTALSVPAAPAEPLQPRRTSPA